MKFVEYSWEPYDKLRRKIDKRKEQIDNLYGTGLYENNDGVEYCFVPTMKMKDMEQIIEHFYSQIKVEDNEVSLCNEIFYTSKIEGAKTTYKRTQEIHDGKKVDHDNYFSEMMVLGGFNATKYLNVLGNKMDEDILIKMWNILTDGARENEDIRGERYRAGNVGVGSHMGLDYRLLDDTMKNWMDFYHSELLEDHPFIKAALLHYSFEFIHPFCDGNGRCGRLLMINYLIDRGYDKLKAVSFSKSIAKDYNGYYSAFTKSENLYTDCTPFIEYMLSIYEDAIEDALDYQEEKEKNLQENENDNINEEK